MSFNNGEEVGKDLRSGNRNNIILMLKKIWIYCWGKRRGVKINLSQRRKLNQSQEATSNQYNLVKCLNEAAGVVYVNETSDTVQHDLEMQIQNNQCR